MDKRTLAFCSIVAPFALLKFYIIVKTEKGGKKKRSQVKPSKILRKKLVVFSPSL